jgi:hypothetical protein
MYKLQARNLKKDNNNNGTRKRFRGGEDPQPGQPTGTDAPSENPPPSVDNLEAPPANEIEALPNNESVEPSVNELEAPPANELEAPPANEIEAPPANELEPAPANELEAPPANELEPAPVNELEAPPANEFEAPPANELESPPANEFETPPVNEYESAPVNEYESASEPTEDGTSAEIEAFRNMMGTSPEAQEVYLYMNTNISTEENRDKSYKREGVLHFTDSVSVGANQTTVMSLGTVIGNRGIETTTYDKLRNVALQKVGILLGETRRCYNTKFDFERNGETILVHIYGTVYSKKSEQPTM